MIVEGGRAVVERRGSGVDLLPQCWRLGRLPAARRTSRAYGVETTVAAFSSHPSTSMAMAHAAWSRARRMIRERTGAWARRDQTENEKASVAEFDAHLLLAGLRSGGAKMDEGLQCSVGPSESFLILRTVPRHLGNGKCSSFPRFIIDSTCNHDEPGKSSNYISNRFSGCRIFV